MRLSRALAWHFCVLVLAASASPLRAEGAQDTSAEAPDLRDALRRFYVHELSAELGLSSTRATEFAPRLDALLDSHRAAARDRIAAGLLLRRAINGADDPTAALAATSTAEDDGRANIMAARAAVLGQLEPREQARFLAFEEPFRARVRELLTRPSASPPGSTTGPAPNAPASRPGKGGTTERNDSIRDTLRLVFVHELRGELGLDDARTLALLGPIDRLFAARQTGDRERRESLERLRSRAADDTARPDELSALVKAALEAERAAAASVTTAQRGVLATLSPREGCQFLLLEQRFIGQARRQLRDARALRERSRGGERPSERAAPGSRERR